MEGFNGYVKYGSMTAGQATQVTCHNSIGTPLMCNTFQVLVSGTPAPSGCAFIFTPSSLIPSSALGAITNANSLTAASGYIGSLIYPGQQITLGAGKHVSSFELRNLGSATVTVVVNYGVETQLNPVPKYPMV
jgi:hypothetical protein